MITSTRRRFADLDDRGDMRQISLVAITPPAAKNAAQMTDIIEGRMVRLLDLVADCGCVPDDTSPSALARNRAIIQDAITAARDSGNSGLILESRGTICVDRSLWFDADNVVLRGVAGSAPVLKMDTWGDPLILLGIDRAPAGVTLTTAHFPDAFGKLDASGAPSAGVRRGYRTGANSHVSCMFGLAALGHLHWAVPKLTVAVCYDSTENAAAGVMFGLNVGAAPSPWYVLRNESAGTIGLYYRTADATPYGGDDHSATIVAPASAGVHRVVFQLDLEAGTCIAFADGVQVTVTGTVPSGATLRANQHAPFHVNMQGPSAISASCDLSSTPAIGQTYYGLSVGVEPRYRNDGVGQPIRRIDTNTAPDDAYLFQSQLADSVFFLSLTDTAAEHAASRSVDFLGGLLVGYVKSRAFVLSPAHGAPENNGGNYLIEDLSLMGGNPNLGQVVVMANTLYPTFRRVGIGDGAVALGSWGATANYTVKLEDCSLNATETALFAYYSILEGYGLRFGRGGRATVRNYSGLIKLVDCFVEGNDFPEVFVWTGLGGQTHVIDFKTDFELAGSPSIAAFYCMTGGNFARAGTLIVEGFVWGDFPSDVPIFLLDGLDAGDRTGYFEAKHLYGSTIPDVYVEEHGVQWSGLIRSADVQAVATPVVHVGGGTGGVTVDVPDHTHTASEIADFSEAVDDRVNSLIVMGANVAKVYDDAGNTYTISSTGGAGEAADHGGLTGLGDDDHGQYLFNAPALTARNTVAIAAAGQVGMTIRAHATQGTTPLWRLRNSGDTANLAEFAAAGHLGVGVAPAIFISGGQPLIHAKASGAGSLASVQVENAASSAYFHAKGATDAGLILEDSGAASQERIFYVASDGGYLKFLSLLNDYTGNADLMAIRRDGYMNVGRGSANSTGIIAALGVQAISGSLPALVGRGAAGQSGNIVEWQDSTGAVQGTVSENGYWTTRKTAAPADAELAAGEMALWLDATNGASKLKIKAKSANGTVVTGEVALA